MVDLAALAVGVAAVVVAGALVPALLEVRRAARSADRLLSEAATRLPGLATRADTLLDESLRLVSETRARVDRLEQAAASLRAPVAAAAVGFREALTRLASRRSSRGR